MSSIWPKGTAPAALLAAQVRFKSGLAGLKRCSASKRDGTPCGRLAAHGLATCIVHHRGARARDEKHRTRCAALTIARPRHQCGHPVKPGSIFCGRHLWHASQGTPLEPMPMGQRVKRVPKRVVHNARPKRKRASPVLAHAAPRALRALPVWRACAGQRERAALVQAYMQRNEHPDTWRAMVRDVLARARENGRT